MKSLAVLEYKIDAQLGEGAFWNHKTQEFYWIDIESKALHIYNPKTKSNRTIITPSRIGTVVPKNENEAVVALEDGIYILNLTSGETNLLSDIEADIPSNRFNDGKCDPSGRLWVGSMGFEMKQYDANLYMVDEHGKAELKIDSVTISNGIVWTKDKKTMYYIDTPTLNIYGYDYNDETGAISNERIAVKIDDSLGSPDGMAIDENDMLWVGMWNGNAVICFDPIKGEIVQKIEVPAHNITSCAFGGKDLDTLYITTASIDMSEEELLKYPNAGSLF
ncbi:MAG: SMP-30/gluconolactonase/LRE family protein, partial [Flavobacteriaceae bacterium]